MPDEDVAAEIEKVLADLREGFEQARELVEEAKAILVGDSHRRDLAHPDPASALA